MSRHRKQKRKDEQAAPKAGRKGPPVAAIIVLGAAVSVAVAFGWRSVAHSDARPATPLAQAESVPRPVVAMQPAFLKLKGKWLRPDGGYVLEIGAVNENGKLDASYLNPRPIHVARAEASREGEAVKMFIELQDVNYPGSTYDLTYDPRSDQLKGVYYQAALHQRFEVFFVRME